MDHIALIVKPNIDILFQVIECPTMTGYIRHSLEIYLVEMTDTNLFRLKLAHSPKDFLENNLTYLAQYMVCSKDFRLRNKLLNDLQLALEVARYSIPWPELDKVFLESFYNLRSPFYLRLFSEWFNTKNKWPEFEAACLKTPVPYLMAQYARVALKAPWVEAEPYICMDAAAASIYIDVVGVRSDLLSAIATEGYTALRHAEKYGRFPQAEPVILQDPYRALQYAILVLKGPWPEAENVLKSHHMVWKEYQDQLKKLQQKPLLPTRRPQISHRNYCISIND